ncbi:MAG TPA: DUF4340 domain-containing protein [Tepidisphaeraceae bacterium]|jgi:hypothetical protein|nr:DUF4340 domain-containing protein [Tepidisphaeraceae bacterium]
MNFKSTLLLLVALVVVGIIVMFRGSPEDQPAATMANRPLLTVDSSDVTAITVTPSAGQAVALTKSTDSNWQLTQPVAAPAEKFEADDLVRDITALESRGQVDASPATGLDSPRYVVKLEANGQSHEVRVGQASSVGENLYVKVDDNARADMVNASLIDRLKKPASAYRQARLVQVASDAIQQLSIKRGDQTIELARSGGKWNIVAPTTMPADAATVGGLLTSLTGLRAQEFIAEGADIALLGQPRLTIAYATEPPSSQPATTQPAMKTITMGRYSDISRSGVLAVASGIDAVVKLPASTAEAFEKKPIELRDRQVLMLEPANVGTVELAINTPATTRPTTAPAANQTIALTRRTADAPAPAGPPAPTPGPATAPAAIQPAEPQSKWVAGDRPADDAAVEALLAALSPLRAEKFIETPPLVAQPAATYSLAITVPPVGPSPGERYELRVIDSGNDAAPIVTYNGLTFEAPQALLTTLQAKMVNE